MLALLVEAGDEMLMSVTPIGAKIRCASIISLTARVLINVWLNYNQHVIVCTYIGLFELFDFKIQF